MASEAINEATRRVWRELGFFCDRNDATKEWRIVGSVKGLRKFAAEIRSYASNPAHDREKVKGSDPFDSPACKDGCYADPHKNP